MFNLKAWSVMQPLIGEHVEALPINLPKRAYFIIHSLVEEDCIDWSRTKHSVRSDGLMVCSGDPTLREDFVPRAHIFRIRGDVLHCFVTPQFVEMAESHGLRGARFDELGKPEPEPTRYCEVPPKVPHTGTANEFGTLEEPVLAQFETQIGFKLPEDYRSHLLAKNGGIPYESDVWLPGEDEPCAQVRGAFGLHNGPEEWRLDYNYQFYKQHMLRGMLPIADDVGGNLFCIVLHGRERGRIYVWDHEMQVDRPAKRNYDFLANSFTEFLNMLRPPSD
jgi:hypothetical protein